MKTISLCTTVLLFSWSHVMADQPMSKRLATKQSLLDSLKKKDLQVFDARSEDEFCGTEKHTNKRPGAIPFVGPEALIYGPDAIFYVGAGTAARLYTFSASTATQ